MIGETGGDMSRFPTAALASWAGLCPRRRGGMRAIVADVARRHGSDEIVKVKSMGA